MLTRIRWNSWIYSNSKATALGVGCFLFKLLFRTTKKLVRIEASERQQLSCSIEGKTLYVTLEPAKVLSGDQSFFAYPREREELVSRALRYVAVQAMAPVSVWTGEKGSQIRVSFSLAQLGSILSEWGDTYTHGQIEESLRILHGTRVSVKASVEDKKGFISKFLIPHYEGLTRRQAKPG